MNFNELFNKLSLFGIFFFAIYLILLLLTDKLAQFLFTAVGLGFSVILFCLTLKVKDKESEK